MNCCAKGFRHVVVVILVLYVCDPTGSEKCEPRAFSASFCSLLSVLHRFLAVRHADHVFSSAVYHNYRAPSEHSYSGFTPTPPYKQYA